VSIAAGGARFAVPEFDSRSTELDSWPVELQEPAAALDDVRHGRHHRLLLSVAATMHRQLHLGRRRSEAGGERERGACVWEGGMASPTRSATLPREGAFAGCWSSISTVIFFLAEASWDSKLLGVALGREPLPAVGARFQQ